jgi:hypothetical protein
MPNLFSLLRGRRRYRAFFTTMLLCVDHVNYRSDVDSKDPEALDLLHYSPVDVDGGVLGPLFPVIHDQLLCHADVEGEVVVLAQVY